jgi:hypothetical protein
MSEELKPGSTPALATALAKANAEINNPAFDKENPHFRSRFASLAAVRNALVPVYAKNGLSVLQDLQTTEKGVACYTHLLHSSGEEKIFGPLVIAPTKQDAQGIAGAGTYAKRIALQGVACVVGDDDDDGETAVGRDTGSTNLQKSGWTGQDTKKANDFAKRIIAAVDEGHDVMELWDEATPAGEEFVRAVWVALPKPIKTLIKDENDKRGKAKAA